MVAHSAKRAHDDKKLEQEAAAVLAGFGLTIADVTRMTLKRVVEDKAVPFPVKIPNAKTRAAMREIEEKIRQRQAAAKHENGLTDIAERDVNHV